MLVGLDWTEPMILLLLHVTCSCIFHAYVPSFISIFDIDMCWCFSACFFLSLFLSLVALWHLNGNLLHLRTLFVQGLLLLLPPLIILHLTSCSMMIKPVRTFQITSHDVSFFRNAKSFYRTSPILTFPLSSTIGVRSHCVASRSPVLS